VVARGDVAMQRGGWASWMVVEREMMWQVVDAKMSVRKCRRSFGKAEARTTHIQ
jgi:hypothetical protein